MSDLVDDRLQIGSVIFEKVDDTVPPKNKYYVVTGFTKDSTLLSTVYINSKINTNIFHNTKLRDLNVEIKKEDNPFLDYDSYVDCSFLHEKNTNDVTALIKSGDTRFGYISTISSDCFEKIITTIKSAHTISLFLKKKYDFLK